DFKAGDCNVKIQVDRKLLKFKRQQCAIPTGILSELIVGNDVGADLSRGQMVNTHRWDIAHTDKFGRLDSAMSCNNPAAPSIRIGLINPNSLMLAAICSICFFV